MLGIKLCMYSGDELVHWPRKGYSGVYFPSCERRNKHQNNPLVSVEPVRHSSTYIILYIMCPEAIIPGVNLLAISFVVLKAV